MRVLVVGAGGVGGYFGARLLASGRDVTFLVRPARAALLREHGLQVISPHGNLDISDPPTILAEQISSPFDLVLLSCKAYDLDGAIESFAPAVGAGTLVLPLLNGMRHLDALDLRFGAARVLGGYCLISTTLDEGGGIRHLNQLHTLAWGPRSEEQTIGADRVAGELAGSGFDARQSEAILQEMWEKWIFIATLAGATCAMRAAIGEILAAGGESLIRGMYDECASIAESQHFPPSPESRARSRALLTSPGSTLTASMLHDVEKGGPTEADHVLGDLLARAGSAGSPASLLGWAYLHLRSYEQRRTR